MLRIRSSGSSIGGTNLNQDNTLVNALETQFNATQFRNQDAVRAVTTRLKGNLGQTLDTAKEVSRRSARAV